jgi:hypothetical protein
VPAPGQPHVIPRDANPLEVRRRREHLANELAVALLDPLSLDQGLPGLSDSIGEAVSDRLELAEVENPWSRSDRVDPVGHLGVAESLPEEGRQLCLEAADLAPQLKSRLALIDAGSEPSELIAFQQSGHQQKL